MKVEPIKISMLGGVEKPTNNTDFIAQLNKKTLCILCKQPDHWWRDRPECRNKMRQMKISGIDPRSMGRVARKSTVRFDERDRGRSRSP